MIGDLAAKKKPASNSKHKKKWEAFHYEKRKLRRYIPETRDGVTIAAVSASQPPADDDLETIAQFHTKCGMSPEQVLECSLNDEFIDLDDQVNSRDNDHVPKDDLTTPGKSAQETSGLAPNGNEKSVSAACVLKIVSITKSMLVDHIIFFAVRSETNARWKEKKVLTTRELDIIEHADKVVICFMQTKEIKKPLLANLPCLLYPTLSNALQNTKSLSMSSSLLYYQHQSMEADGVDSIPPPLLPTYEQLDYEDFAEHLDVSQPLADADASHV
ncbi:hypothetical protein BJV82DRAFT_662909 [Fennellomyces sp. T-0311]|nr:hypothetical protein BJV82DRAFT_662909 [Fennellomyces sp. T-0311]